MRFRLANGLAALPTTVQRRIAGAPVVRDGQQLDLETQLWLKLLALADAPDRDAMTVTEVRAMVAAEEGVTQGHRLDGIRVHEPTIDGAAGLLGARLYVPDRTGSPASDGDGDALLVYYHGGGFVVCDLETHDNPCRFLALHAGVRVLSVDYRMAPEDPFPAAFDDAVAAFRYAVAHADELGADPARIAVGGDSAGGNLAAGVARVAAGDSGPGPALQVLLYPWLDLAEKRPSYELFGEGFDLTDADLEWFTGHYLPDCERRARPALLADPGAGPRGPRTGLRRDCGLRSASRRGGGLRAAVARRGRRRRAPPARRADPRIPEPDRDRPRLQGGNTRDGRRAAPRPRPPVGESAMADFRSDARAVEGLPAALQRARRYRDAGADRGPAQPVAV